MDPELIELELDDDEAHEPLDLTGEDRRLNTQPYDLSVRQLVNDVESGKILLTNVIYQREYVWDDAKASRLIESLLLNVPIPVCYFAENEDGVWEVIDGLQRCRSIVRFLTEEDLTLKGLPVLTELNGLTFEEVAPRDQRRIENRTIRCVVISEDSHPDIKFDVFERLNTGAVKLTAQELRNAVYRGAFNEALKTLSNDEDFRRALARDKDSRMHDEELVLRFLSLYEGLLGYRPPLTQFLNEYMRKHQYEDPEGDLAATFRNVMKTVHEVLGEEAFRMPQEDKLSKTVNRALFDAVTISFAFADRDAIRSSADLVIEGHRKLVRDEKFAPMVGRATADRTRMRGRIGSYTSMLRSLDINSAIPDLSE